MAADKMIRIDPLQIAGTKGPKPKASITGSAFGDIMSITGALAPVAGEVGYQATGNSNAAAVLHSAFSALPGAYGAAGGSPGMYGAASYSTMGGGGYGGGIGGMGDGGASIGAGYGGSTTGMGQVDQAQLIDTMNTNNLHLLELQAVMQNNMQQWTTKSNIYKSIHDSKMAMIQHFAVRG